MSNQIYIISFLRKRCLYFLVLTFLLLNNIVYSSNISVPPDLEIFLCIGQSNMAGRGEILGQDMGFLNDVYLFNDASVWENAENPLNRYSTIGKAVSLQKLGPSWEFAKALSSYGKKVGLVVNARGGTAMSEWVPGTIYYNEALSRVLAAQANGGVVKGIIWHQGESDRNNFSTYTAKFVSMIQAFRQDLSLPNLPVIVGEIGQWRPESVNINLVISKLKNNITNLDYVSATGLTHNGDLTHFDSKSQRILGVRYAHKYLELTKQKSVVNIQIPIMEDTFADGYSPNVIQGGLIYAVAKNHFPEWERTILLKFNLSSVPGPITSAILHINGSTIQGNLSNSVAVDVFEQDDNWYEDVTTFNNFTGNIGNFISNFYVYGDGFDTPYAVDISISAEKERIADQILSVAFKLHLVDNKNDFKIVTKEDTLGLNVPAYIDLYYSPLALSIDDLAVSEFIIYPNPTNNILNVQSLSSMISHIKLFSIDGKKILEIHQVNSNKLEINISSLKRGIYLLKLFNNQGDFNTKKLIKE